MTTYVILSKLSPLAFDEPGKFKDVAAKVATEIKERCPGTTWRESYATTGRYDCVDIIETDNPTEVTRAAMIIRGFGRSTTETLTATPWKEFLGNL